MLIATFESPPAWVGKTIEWDSTGDGQFVLVGAGPMSAAEVMRRDGAGQLVWASDETRAWVGARADSQVAHPPGAEPAIQQTTEFPCHQDEVFYAALAAVPTVGGMRVVSSERPSGQVAVKVGLGGLHWGADVLISVAETAPGRTLFSITSTPKGVPVLGDVTSQHLSENRKIVDKIISATRQQLTSRPPFGPVAHLIATFNDTTGWRGQTVTFEDEQFILEGHGRVSPKNVMKYDEKAQLEWASHGMRAWVGSRTPGAEEGMKPAASTQPIQQAMLPESKKPILLAVFGPDSEWPGKRIVRTGLACDLEGHFALTPDEVLELDRQHQLIWSSDDLRAGIQAHAAAPSPTWATFGSSSPLAGTRLIMANRWYVIEGRGPILSAYLPDYDSQLVWASENMRSIALADGQAAHVATFAQASEHGGEKVVWVRDRYFVQADEPISPAELMEYDRHGHLVWATAGWRATVQARASARLVATFGADSVWIGKTITEVDGQLFLEDYGPISQVEFAAIRRQGRLEYVSEEIVQEASDAYLHIPAKSKKIYDANSGSKAVDFVIVGSSSQCLVALPQSCIIVKPGFMAGATGGGRFTEFHYTDITGIEVNTGIVNAVVEVTTPAYQGKSKDFWSGGKDEDPFRVSNCLPGSKSLFCQGEGAARIEQLRVLVRKAKQVHATAAPAATAPVVDHAEKIRKLAQLRADGILTAAEFDEAKQKILGSL